MKENLESLLAFARETVYLGGKISLRHFQTDLKFTKKADNSPVTIADKEVEQFIRSRIQQHYPGHAILGEEQGEEGADDADFRWIIDPIDGTKSFMRGIPTYSSLLGLEIEGNVQLGVIYCPAMNEMVYAAKDLGCWWNANGHQRRARVSEAQSLDEGIITFGDPIYFPMYQKQQAFERLQQKAYFRAGYCDAYGHLLVATGRAELMLDPIVSTWDCGPLPIILQEAGGYFGDWQGNPVIDAEEGLSTTQALLPQVLELINQ